MADQSNLLYPLTRAFKQSKAPASNAVALPESVVCFRAPSSCRARPSRLLLILLLSLVGAFLIPCTLTMAQTAAGSSVAPSKQTQKEQQKADRKARRAKKNAELRKAENNGFQPGWGNNADTQQSLQNEPHKAAPKPGNSSPASAP